MAVLIEAISVVVRRDALDQRFPGGWSAFVEAVPNESLCTDGHLARVGFMSPDDVREFVMMLESEGLIFQQNGKAIDLAVIDQQRGATIPADWLEFGKISFYKTGSKVAAAWLFEGQRIAAGIHLPASGLSLATPAGWEFEDSLSAKFEFVPNDEVDLRLEFVKREDGVNVFRDRSSGKLVYQSGRPIGE
jgi:hypothetical protein